jgi:predicted transcriptional regulator
MPLLATSLKLPAQLKKRLTRLAHEAGQSPHALMVEALARQADALEQHAAFVADAERADAQMKRSGQGYAMDDIHQYFREKARGESPRRPRPVRWRR